MYISMKFGTGVYEFCWEVNVFNRSRFCSVSCNYALSVVYGICHTAASDLFPFLSKLLQVHFQVGVSFNCYKNLNTILSMLITLPRGCEKCPFGSLFSFIHIMFFHFHGIMISGGTRGPVTSVSLHLVILMEIISIKTYFPMHKKIVNTCSRSNITV